MLRDGSAEEVAFHERSLSNGTSRVDLATACDSTSAEMTQNVDAFSCGTRFVQLVTNAFATPEHANILR